jgi:hypothetical protein
VREREREMSHDGPASEIGEIEVSWSDRELKDVERREFKCRAITSMTRTEASMRLTYGFFYATAALCFVGQILKESFLTLRRLK